MKRKIVTAVLLSMALSASVIGCGTTAATSSSSAVSADSETESGSEETTASGAEAGDADAADEEAVYGKVTSVDGNSVTVTVGTFENGQFTEGTETAVYDLADASVEKESMGDFGGNVPGMGGGPGGDSSSSESGTDNMPQGGPGGDGTMSGMPGGDGQEPPAKPGESSDSTENGSGSGTPDGQTPPDLPSDGTMSGVPDMDGTMSGAPSGDGQMGGEFKPDTEDASVSDIAEGDVLEITLDDSGAVTAVTIKFVMNGEGGMPGDSQSSGGQGESGEGGSGGSFGSNASEVEQGDAATTITEDSEISGETYTSTNDDENALRVDGATVTLDNIDVEKTGGASSNTEAGDFYGMNAGLLATNGATVTITNSTVNTTQQNGNGVFSYGSGTTVNISDTTITTTADNSGGIQTTGGGTTNAENLTVTTAGNSSAAIRSDRGGGTVNVDGGTYTSNGYNSPAVYSTADITVENAALTASNSEALVIEGANSIALTDTNVTGNMSDTEGTSSDINVHNVMIYQSMSGDAAEGTSSFSMSGGSLTSENGDMFFITNTACTVDLENVTLNNQDSDANLMTISGNDASHGWGTAGSNGAQVTMTCKDQALEGDITVDSISTLDLTFSGTSTFDGTINIVDNAEGGTAVDGNAVVTLETGSTWNLTGDCTVTSVSGDGTINYNGYTITLADGTVLSE